MAAFKEGYSWNTLLNGGADLRDALRVKKSGSTVKIAGGQSTATLEGKVTKVCMVRARCWAPGHNNSH